MFEIVGLSKATLMFVVVAIATNHTELRRILAEEADAYYNLTWKRLRCGSRR